MRHALALAAILTSVPSLAQDPAPAPTPLVASAAGPVKGAFGLTASFIGEGTGGTIAPTVGFTYLVSDTVALTFGGGFEIESGAGTTVYGMTLGVGFQLYLGQAGKNLRPFLAGGLAFDKRVDNGSNSTFDMDLSMGGGAEYWLTESFSVNARALLVVPMQFGGGGSAIVTIATVSPGIGATFYF